MAATCMLIIGQYKGSIFKKKKEKKSAHLNHNNCSINWEMRKLSARWVPCLHSAEDEQNCMVAFQTLIVHIWCNLNEFLCWFVTVDEKWTRHDWPKIKEQSKQWIVKGELASKKTVKSAGKVMATVFWDECGIIPINYLERGKTISGQYYASLLSRLNKEIKR